MPTSPPTQYYAASTEIADLGALRFDHDTAAPSDKDYALKHAAPVVLPAGRAQRGYESKTFAWHALQHTTEERDERAELKADLHEGQLHRLNRMAGGGGAGGGGQRGAGAGAGGGGKKKKGMGGGGGESKEEGLCAGRKPDGGVAPPLAKGAAEELGRELFWEGEIV